MKPWIDLWMRMVALAVVLVAAAIALSWAVTRQPWGKYATIAAVVVAVLGAVAWYVDR